MSFFSRLNNLVKGFSHNIQDRMEKEKPNIGQRQSTDATNIVQLQEAARRFAQLEQEMDTELLSANSVERVRLLRKKKEYRSEQEKIRALLKTQETSHKQESQTQASHTAEKKSPPHSPADGKVQRRL